MKHFRARDLEEDDVRLTPEAKRRLVVHLGQQCGPCWRAVSRLTRRDPRSLADPVQRAMHRFRSPHRLELDSGHLRSLRAVQTQVLGFAELVLQEAHSTSGTQAWAQAHNLVDHFLAVESGPDVHDLAATRELLRARKFLAIPLVADLSEKYVQRALRLAEQHSVQGNHSPLLQAQISFWRSQRLRHRKRRVKLAEKRALARILKILDSDPLLRFELAREIALRRIYEASTEGWSEARHALELAFAQTRDLPKCDQLHGLYVRGQVASVAATFLTLDDQQDGQQLFEIFEALASELEEALPAVRLLGDSQSEGWFCYWIGNLRRDRQVLTWWFRALTMLAECGSEKAFLRIASKTPLLGQQVSTRRGFLREAQTLAKMAFGRGLTAATLERSLENLTP